MRPIVITFSPTVATVGAVAASQTPSGAGAVTINGTLATGGVATLGDQQIVTIASAADISNRTFVVTGTDNTRQTVSETITGPNNATVSSTKNYKTITGVTISGAAAGAITMGVSGLGSSYPVVLDRYIAPWQVAIAVTTVTGTLTYKLQYTYDDVFASTWPNGTQVWFDSVLMVSKTAAYDTVINAAPVAAVRFVITTAGSPQSITGRIIQAGLP